MFFKDGRFTGTITSDSDDFPWIIPVFILISIIFGIVKLIQYISSHYVHFVQWMSVNSPYKELLIYYSYILKPAKYIFASILTLIKNVFSIYPSTWKYIVISGLTKYPNINLVIGILAMVLYLSISLALSALIVFIIRIARDRREVRTAGHIYIGLIVVPPMLLVVWLVLKTIIAWLFMKK